MKDLQHHRNYVQKKILQKAKKESMREAALNGVANVRVEGKESELVLVKKIKKPELTNFNGRGLF